MIEICKQLYFIRTVHVKKNHDSVQEREQKVFLFNFDLYTLKMYILLLIDLH
jgi:hypothetical protein